MKEEPEPRRLGLYRLPMWFVRDAWAARPRPPPEALEQSLARAAWHGDAAMLEWARGVMRGSEQCWGRRVCAMAAGGGALAALQWLRAWRRRCPWDRWTGMAAAAGGHLHVLQIDRVTK
ncbi:MAG: hypothetical protein J3K34DRAFT_470311 [Monoraphidium minutum]|nr:MAG: hypothetical protein J3K34DRAFT_470311 [Monoraphidium minutum]